MTSLDERADALIVAWQEARSTGAPTSLDALLDENPDLAEALRERAKALLAMESAFAPSGQALEAGARLGPFRVLRQLGHGGMGVVHEALVEEPNRGLEPGHHVALKFVHPHLLASGDFFGRFLREAELGRRIRHPNLVRTYGFDAILAEGVPHRFLVMDYVHGQTLRQLLGDLEVVPEDLCHHIALEVAKGLAAMHEAGAVHRDLKPENVIITDDHEVRIMDLGVAQTAQGALSITKTGQFLGSILYAAPEQFRGQPLDGRADLHALGVVLYEMATGEHPYRDEDPHVVLGRVLGSTPRRVGERNPQLSPFFEEVVHTLLAKDREQRFASASELAGVLDAGEEGAWWSARAKALRSQTGRPLRRIRVPRETALYGRDEDLAHLRTLYEKAKGGEGQVLLLEGEAGIGKTRLIDEFVGRLRQQGEDVDFLFGSYPPGGAATASGAFAEAFREHFGAESLEETLAGHLTETPILVPALAALLKGDVAPADAEPLTKDSLQTVFVHATRSLAAQRTIVLLIDDLHFAFEDGRALFTALALAVPEHRVLLIGTMRPGVPEAWTAGLTRLEYASQRVLSRLGPKDLGKLFRDVFRSDRLADELGWRIAEKSDGNPFFAFEIIRGLKEGQFITQQPDGTWVTTKIIQEIEVPSSVLDLVNARVADLSDEEREILDVASCCGFEFDGSLVADALRRERIPILRLLGHIEQKHRLVRAAGRRYVFDHHQVQEALYGALSEVLREEYHDAIATALERRYGTIDGPLEELDGALCVDLCTHLLRGAQPDRALRYMEAALSHLQASFLNEEAIALADGLLRVPGLLQHNARFSVLRRKYKLLELLGRQEAQTAALHEMQELADQTGDTAMRLTVEAGWGAQLAQTGRLDEAEQRLRRALSMAREAEDREREATVRGNLGLVQYYLGRHEEAKVQLESQLAIARAIGSLEAEAAANGSLGNVLRSLGRPEEAQHCLERQLTLARETEDGRHEVAALGSLGTLFMEFGRHDEATVQMEQALAASRRVGWRRGETVSAGNLGSALLELGRHEEAREIFERLLALSRETRDPRGEALATQGLGAISLILGRYEQTRAHYEHALAVYREAGDREKEARVLVNLGPLWTSLGERDRAKEVLEQSLSICREIGARYPEGYGLQGLGQLADEDGDAALARRLLGQSLALRREIGHIDGVVDSLWCLADLERRAGRLDEARAATESVLDHSREQGSSAYTAHAMALLALLPGGDPAVAEEALEQAGEAGNTIVSRYHLWMATGKPEHLAEAKRLLDYRVEHAPEEYRESMLKNVRLNREIMEAWEKHGEKAEGEGDVN